MTQYTLHAQVLELRALHDDGRAVHIPVAINNTELGDEPVAAIRVLENRIERAASMARAMFAARPEIQAAPPEGRGAAIRKDIDVAAGELVCEGAQ